jgi:ATP-dependent Lon protease
MLLYPEAVVPLHLFEPRYRQMMADMVQAGEDRMVIAALRPGYEPNYHDAPPVFDIAGVGRVLKCHRLTDGRWNIVLQGERRVKLLRETDSGRLYRRARVMELVEPPVIEPEAGALRRRLGQALEDLLGGGLCLPADADPGYLADVLLLQLPLELPERHALFALVDPAVRAEAVLGAYSRSASLSAPRPFHPDCN